MNFESKSVMQWKGCFHCWIPHRRKRDRKRRPAPSLMDINRGVTPSHSVASTPILPRHQTIATAEPLLLQASRRDGMTTNSSLILNQHCNVGGNMEGSRNQTGISNNRNVEARYVQDPTISYIHMSECTSAFSSPGTSLPLSPLTAVSSSPATFHFWNSEMKALKSVSSSRDGLDIPILPPPLPPNNPLDEDTVKMRCENGTVRSDTSLAQNRDTLDLIIPAPRATICSLNSELSYVNNNEMISTNESTKAFEKCESGENEIAGFVASKNICEENKFDAKYQEESLARIIHAQSSLRSNFGRSSSLCNGSSDYTPMGSAHSRFSKTSVTLSPTQSLKFSQFGKVPTEFGYNKSFEEAYNDLDNYDLMAQVPRKTSYSSDCTVDSRTSSLLRSPCLDNSSSNRLLNSDFNTNIFSSPTSSISASGKLFLHASFSSPTGLTGYHSSRDTLPNFVAVPPPVPCRSYREKHTPFYFNDPVNIRNCHRNGHPLSAIQSVATVPSVSSHPVDHSEYIQMDNNEQNKSDDEKVVDYQDGSMRNAAADQHITTLPSTVQTGRQNGHLSNRNVVTCTANKSLPYSDIALPRRRNYSAVSSSDDETDEDTDNENSDEVDSNSRDSNSSCEAKDVSISLKQISVNHNKSSHVNFKPRRTDVPISMVALSSCPPPSAQRSTDVQYLDLDLDDPDDLTGPDKGSPRPTPRHIRQSDKIDYKEIDFSKTEALKATKRQLESERSINS